MGKYKKWIIGILGLGISGGAIYYLMQKVDFRESFELLGTVAWYWPVIMVSVYMFTYVLRGFRWKRMLKNFPDLQYKTLFNSIMVGFAGNNIIPARGGELLRMEFFNRQTNINRVTALSSVFAERVLDGISLVVILLVSTWAGQGIMEQNAEGEASLWIITGIFAVAIGGLITLRVAGPWIISLLRKQSSKLFDTVAGIVEKIYEATDFVRLDGNFLMVLALSMLIWLIEGGMFILGISAFGLDVPVVLAGYLMLAYVNFALLVPSSPGYVGVFQMATIYALGLFGVAETPATAASVLIHICQFVPVTVLGIAIILRHSIALFSSNSTTDTEDPAVDPQPEESLTYEQS